MVNICSKCRAENSQDSEFCGSCGTALFITQNTQSKRTSFPDAIRLGFQHYFDFRSRSTRAEYWWLVLFAVLVNIIIIFFRFSMFSGLFGLAVLIPSFALGARRLHDINKSGWWQLLFFLPLLAIPLGFLSLGKYGPGEIMLTSAIPLSLPMLILIWWATKPSDEGRNKYGPPRQQATSQ